MVYELQRNNSACKFNPLNTELSPTFHLLALLEPHHILRVSRIRVKDWPQRELLNMSKFLENGIILLCLNNYLGEIWISHDSECETASCTMWPPEGWNKFTDNPK